MVTGTEMAVAVRHEAIAAVNTPELTDPLVPNVVRREGDRRAEPLFCALIPPTTAPSCE